MKRVIPLVALAVLTSCSESSSHRRNAGSGGTEGGNARTDAGNVDAIADASGTGRADANVPGSCDAPYAAASGSYDNSLGAETIVSACGSPAASGPAVAYSYSTAFSGRLTVTVSSAVDLGLSLREACEGAEIACIDEIGGGDQLDWPVVTGDAVSFLVYGHGSTDAGPFNLAVAFKAAECGDALLDGGEECDDGNLSAADGCSASCTLETCEMPPELSAGVPVTGTTQGASLVSTRCANHLSGPEAIYRFIAPSSASYRFTVTPSANIDFVLALRTVCGAAQDEQCVDANFAGDAEAVSVSLDAGESRFVIIDGWGVPDAGDFTLEVGQDG